MSKHTADAQRGPERLIDQVLAKAQENGFTTKWYVISNADASRLVKQAWGPTKHPPRPGYFVELPTSRHNGYSGHWNLSNTAGHYELQFMYR